MAFVSMRTPRRAVAPSCRHRLADVAVDLVTTAVYCRAERRVEPVGFDIPEFGAAFHAVKADSLLRSSPAGVQRASNAPLGDNEQYGDTVCGHNAE